MKDLHFAIDIQRLVNDATPPGIKRPRTHLSGIGDRARRQAEWIWKVDATEINPKLLFLFM